MSDTKKFPNPFGYALTKFRGGRREQANGARLAAPRQSIEKSITIGRT